MLGLQNLNQFMKLIGCNFVKIIYPSSTMYQSYLVISLLLYMTSSFVCFWLDFNARPRFSYLFLDHHITFIGYHVMSFGILLFPQI